MSATIRTYEEADLERLRGLLAHASIAGQFDKFQGPHGLEHKLADPRLERASIHLAFVDGTPAGFGFGWRLPQASGAWVMMRVGVLEAFRRRGLGGALARAVIAYATAAAPRGSSVEMAGSAWVPAEGAEALARSLGFRHERWFWLMERPRGARREPDWPAGIVTRSFDGSAQALADWNDAYNDSFAKHFRFVRSSVEDARRIVEAPAFRADGLLLAYRGERCLGFCRNVLYESRGEIAVLGTRAEARGIGLGRALLRWGVGWLEASSPQPVTLVVDGENEGALALYRAEGFTVARTREIWGRAEEGRA